jgi:hypothetical protein
MKDQDADREQSSRVVEEVSTLAEIKSTRLTRRRSFLGALGLGLAGTTALLFGTRQSLAQRRRSDHKTSNDRDYYQNADIKAPISNQGRGGYSDGDRPRSNDFKQSSDRD